LLRLWNPTLQETKGGHPAFGKVDKEHGDVAEKLQQAEKMREAFKAQQQRTHDHERDRER
jgi:hypothetical protein